jgi:small subunit ribosomal protein S4
MATYTSQGQRGKKRPRPLSEYGKQLKEKQKLKTLYNLREAQLRKIVKEASSPDLLINLLESRLDNVVFRLGLAQTREQARQLVSHDHFLVNGRHVNIPGYQVKKGDTLSLKEKSVKKSVFQNILPFLKKQKLPAWLELDIEKLEGKIIGRPQLEEVSMPVEIPVIFEYYSR